MDTKIIEYFLRKCNYIPSDIRTEILNDYLSQYTTINHNQIQVHVFTNAPVLPDSVFHQVTNALYILSEISSKHLEMYIFPLDRPKIMPLSGPIGIDNCSSGVTFYPNHQIFIWRLEELDKVMIHEALHAWDIALDISDLNYQEAYIEALATYLWTSDIQAQIPWMLSQARKILDWDYPLPKDPAIFGYYVIKVAILHNLPEFVKLWEKDINPPAQQIESLISQSLLQPIFISELEKTQIDPGNPSLCMTQRPP